MRLLLIIQPFVALVTESTTDTTGGTVHGPKLIYHCRDGLNGKEYVYAAEDCTARNMPACCWAEHDATPEERLYAAYNRSGPPDRAGLSWDGNCVVTWEELMTRAQAGDIGALGVVEKWRATARFALDFLPHHGAA